MADTAISSLDEVTSPGATDVLPVVNLGTTKKVQVQHLGDGMPVATSSAKGLMSAADKVALAQAQADIAELQTHPVSVTVASASNVAIPDGADVILLTGTTSVASVSDGVPYKTYTFAYPSGAGLTFLGVVMSAGDALVAVYKP